MLLLQEDLFAYVFSVHGVGKEAVLVNSVTLSLLLFKLCTAAACGL